MAAIAHDLLDLGYPFLMEKPMGINAHEVEGVAINADKLGAFIAVPLAQRYGVFARKPANCWPRSASAPCRTFTSGSTGRAQHAIQVGIAWM
jgi:hypothetical protein